METDTPTVADAARDAVTEATFAVVTTVPVERGGAVMTVGVMALTLVDDLMPPTLGFTLVPSTLEVEVVTEG